MGDLTTNTIAGDNESKRISCLVDTKYYDELITKKHLQAREEHERSIQSPPFVKSSIAFGKPSSVFIPWEIRCPIKFDHFSPISW
jgi:hypothetical protein